MASKKEVTVVINGEEFVSQAAKKADDGMTGFASKVPGWAKTAALMAVAFEVVSRAVGSVKDFVVDSFAAFDTYAASQNKMAAQSKLTGVSMAELNATAKTAREEFGLGSVVANDAATTVAKYATRAGDAAQKNKLLSAALNLGAASGLDAAASMDALEQGLRGQDEGFDKLLGKNPSAIWKEYADANGIAVGKMTDTQKRMAEMTAVIAAGNIVGDTYTERMKSAAGQQEMLNNKLENAKVAFGAALQPVRALVIQGLVKLVEVATPVVLWLGQMANSAGLILGGAFQTLRGATGAVAEAFGKLTRNESLEAWGRAQVTAADAAKKAIEAMGTASTVASVAHEQAAVKTNVAVKSSADSAEREAARVEAAINQKLGAPLRMLMVMTQTAIDDLGKSAREQLPIEKARQFEAHMQGIAANARAISDRIEALPKPTETTKGHVQRIAEDMTSVARTALDAGQAFGVIDAKSASALTSVINLGSSVAKLFTGNIAGGITGIVAATASLITGMTRESNAYQVLQRESQQRLKENTAALGDLTEIQGAIALGVSGGQYSSIKDAVGDILSGNYGAGMTRTEALQGKLSAAGISWEDFKKFADKMGLKLFDKNGTLDEAQLIPLFAKLMKTNVAGIGSDYGSQLDIAKQGFGVNGTDGAGQISDLLGVGAKFSPALAGIFDPKDLPGTRKRLAKLFEQLRDGTLSPAMLGKMNGSEFLSLITDIISRIDGLKTDVAAASSSGADKIDGGLVSTTTIPGVGKVSTGGVAETVQDVMKSQTTALSSILTAQTALHTEIAKNTGDTVRVLVDIRALLSDRERANLQVIDEGLEARRRGADAYSGVLPVLV